MFHRLDNQRAIPGQQWGALRPTSGDIDHRQILDERSRHRRAAMGDLVDLAETCRWAFPVIERPDRDLTPDCRIEAHASPPAAARYDFDVDKQAVDGCCADGQNMSAISEAKLQSAMLLGGRQQRRDHLLEPVAADAIRRQP